MESISLISRQAKARSTHGSELPFVFGVPLLPAVWPHLAPGADDFDQQEAALSLAVMTYWTNFAKTGWV